MTGMRTTHEAVDELGEADARGLSGLRKEADARHAGERVHFEQHNLSVRSQDHVGAGQVPSAHGYMGAYGELLDALELIALEWCRTNAPAATFRVLRLEVVPIARLGRDQRRWKGNRAAIPLENAARELETTNVALDEDDGALLARNLHRSGEVLLGRARQEAADADGRTASWRLDDEVQTEGLDETAEVHRILWPEQLLSGKRQTEGP